MKRPIIFLITILLCLGITACGGKQDQGDQGTTMQTTTAQATTAQATAPAENPLGFDPNNAKDWYLETEEDWQKWSDWMKSKGLQITGEDSIIGNFEIGMSLKDAQQYFPSKALSEKTYDDVGGSTISTLTFKGIELTFGKGKNTPYELVNISVVPWTSVTIQVKNKIVQSIEVNMPSED